MCRGCSRLSLAGTMANQKHARKWSDLATVKDFVEGKDWQVKRQEMIPHIPSPSVSGEGKETCAGINMTRPISLAQHERKG